MVPFDGKGLFEKMGGADKATARMDRFFHKEDGSWAVYREGRFYSDVSDQPSINAPWIYLFAGTAIRHGSGCLCAVGLIQRGKPGVFSKSLI